MTTICLDVAKASAATALSIVDIAQSNGLPYWIDTAKGPSPATPSVSESSHSRGKRSKDDLIEALMSALITEGNAPIIAASLREKKIRVHRALTALRAEGKVFIGRVDGWRGVMRWALTQAEADARYDVANKGRS
jgi:hypothetical protein